MARNSQRLKDIKTLALLAAVSLAFYPVFRKPALLLLALGLLVTGLLFEKAAARLASAWLGFSAVLGEINTKIVLGAVYLLLLTPLALIFRLFNGNALLAKADPAAKTYFTGGRRLFAPADLEKTW